MSLSGDYSIPLLIVGVASLLVMILTSKSTIEDMFVVLDKNGIEQWRIFHRGVPLVRCRVAWVDVDSFTSKRLLYRFKSADCEVCVSIVLFNDGDEFIRYIEACLPPDKLVVPIPQRLLPSRKIVVWTWIFLVATFIGGLWLSFDGRALTGSPHASAWGCAIVVAAIVWAGRAIESSSVVLDSNGLAQTKLFHRGRLFARRRLAWKDVTKTSSFLSTIKFMGDDLFIRVDASYFDETEEVHAYVNAHSSKGHCGK